MDKRCWNVLILLGPLVSSSALSAKGALENPSQGSIQSGIGVISGWYCNANNIEIAFDDRSLKMAAYGTSRADTEAVCNDENNGFSLLWHYGLLGKGQHRVRAYADGVKFADKSFTVGIINNGEYLRGVEAEYTLPDFPADGTNTSIIWSESAQNFAVKESFSGSASNSLDGTYELYRSSVQWNDESILDTKQSNVSATGTFRINGENAFQSMTLTIDGKTVQIGGSFEILDNNYYISIKGGGNMVIVDRGDRLITMRHISDNQNDFAEVDYWRRTGTVSMDSFVEVSQKTSDEENSNTRFGGLVVDALNAHWLASD